MKGFSRIVVNIITLTIISFYPLRVEAVTYSNLRSDTIQYKTSPTTYYIDNDQGVDTNDGITPSTPWKTVSKVNAQAFNPGDSVLFKSAQVWNEMLSITSSGTSTYPIYIGAYGNGEKPLIETDESACMWVQDAEYITISDFRLRNANHGLFITGDSTGLITVTGLSVSQIDAENGISIKNRPNIIINACEIYECAGCGISAYSLDLTTWDDLMNHNITVKNSIIYDNQKNGVYVAGHHANISDNEVYSNGASVYHHNIYLIGDYGLVEHNEVSYSPDGDGFRYEGVIWLSAIIIFIIMESMVLAFGMIFRMHLRKTKFITISLRGWIVYIGEFTSMNTMADLAVS